ncbi:MAG: hypothetical protein H3C63_12265 [Candidatus Omnitrophica bacterium]|nr:hypothetical protein [Candidatus Omnitrophota bacterium]
MAPGESFLAEFPEPGRYIFANQENPAQRVTVVVVDEQPESGHRIFLPAVQAGN